MERRCQLEDRVLGRSGARPCRCAPAVFVVGASSTGKTTLCMALAKELGVGDDRWIREVARNVMKTQGFSRDRTQEYEMQHAIMTAQLQAEERVLSNVEEKQSSLLLSDRSAVDPTVYALTSGVAEAQPNHQRLLQDPAFQATLPFYRRSLFVVLQPVPEWLEDDGVRSLEDPWNYNTHLRTTLTKLGIPFIEIDQSMKDMVQRVKFVREHLHNMDEAQVDQE